MYVNKDIRNDVYKLSLFLIENMGTSSFYKKFWLKWNEYYALWEAINIKKYIPNDLERKIKAVFSEECRYGFSLKKRRSGILTKELIEEYLFERDMTYKQFSREFRISFPTLNAFIIENELRRRKKNQTSFYKICPKTLKILKKYRSITESTLDGFTRYIISTHLSSETPAYGFYWLKKDRFEIAIQKIKEMKPKNINKEIIYFLFIEQGKTSAECADILNCDKKDVLKVLRKYDLRKYRIKNI